MTKHPNHVAERTYMVTFIDEQIRPRTTYEKITKIVNDWCMPVFLTLLFIIALIGH